MDDTISLLIASRHEDDQQQILTALSGQINYNTAGIANDETGVIIKTEILKPDILILDWQLSETSGHKLIRIIHSRSPSTSIIIIYDNARKQEEDYSDLQVMTGISGFILKESDIDKLAYIIKIIIMGGCYISASITLKVFNMAALIKTISNQDGHTSLSQLERSIIELLARGFNGAEIAEELNYSNGTINNCMTAIKRKMNRKNHVGIVTYSLASGIIRPEHILHIKEKN